MIETLKEIKKKAKEDKIPIIEDKSLKFLTDYIKKHSVKKILEVGSAVGYSSICMAMVDKDIQITTIEKDENRYLEAVKNIKKMDLEKQIHIFFKDALEISFEDSFDLIFIDAAKGKNQQFFEHFEKNLKEDGVIFTDNINFHGLTKTPLEEIESKNVRSLVLKIRSYIAFLQDHPNYDTTFYEIGDGISMTQRKKDG